MYSRQRHAQRRERARVLLHLRVERAQRALRRVQIARLAEQVTEPLQSQRSDAIARRRSVVRSRLGANDQLFVIAAGEEEAAGDRIFEAREQRIGQRLRKV